MQKIIRLLHFAIALLLFSCTQEQEFHPVPTEGTVIAAFGEESGDNQAKREKWIAKMHGSAPNVDWKAVEFKNQRERLRKIQDLNNREDCAVIENLPIEFNTDWTERGSVNQSGSVFATDYNEQDGKIYLVSAGGTIWKGGPQGDAWEVVNQDFQFGVRSLKIVPLPNGSRILSSINGQPVYSDDGGVNWETASGISTSNASQAILRGFKQLNDGQLFCWAKGSYWDDYQLYSSVDNGQNWSSIFSFTSNSSNHFAICQPHHSDDLFLFLKPPADTSELLRWNHQELNFDTVETFKPDFTPSTRAIILGDKYDEQFRFFVLGSNSTLYRTNDLGASWEKLGQIGADPWSVGLFLSPSDSSLIVSGEVDLWKSTNSGKLFTRQNGWAEYYNDPYSKLHADMMYVNEFEIYGLPMILISHHGGLSLSSDHLNNTANLSLQTLNVSQYYSVRTDPINSNIVYAGSQDQGFQRGNIDPDSEDAANFDQVISGDYGHIVFSNHGSGMWTVYPGGWVTFYDNPQNGFYIANFEVISDDESTWLPALAAIPGSNSHDIYMAGGSINLDESGSFLIKLTYQGGTIQAEQFDFNFLAASGDVISSIEVSPLAPNRIYVGTQNGTFYSSLDGGLTWIQGNDFLPTGHYLYGAAIHASRTNADEVYYAGSGYANEATWVSYDNGQNFSALGSNIPQTLVFDLDGSADDNWIFAATENGPYMYLKETDSWYSLTATCLPVQTNWSVEWLETEGIARFGTYGRGIWDIAFTPIDVATEELSDQSKLQVYPNPSQESISFIGDHEQNFQRIELLNITGQLVKTWENKSSKTSLSLADITSGTYYLRTTSEQGNQSFKIVKIN